MRESRRPEGRKGFWNEEATQAEQVVGKLRQADVALGKGVRAPQAAWQQCQQLCASQGHARQPRLEL